MTECNHQCAGCPSAEGCSEKEESLLKPQNQYSNIKHVIAVMSGKGGVGKSMVTSLLASNMKSLGYRVGILDADITGPSIPKCFGIKDRPTSMSDALLPVKSKNGIEIMSSNLLLEEETDPVLWRGPIIAGLVEQFWTDVAWGELDYLFVDMPPGTGDVPLTVFQSLPVDGIICVTSPQDLVGMIVEKAVKMAGALDIKVISLIENMAYFVCPNCGDKHYIFGESDIESLSQKYEIPCVEQVPIDNKIAELADMGLIDSYLDFKFDKTIKEIEKMN